ncbi:MAG: FecR domain-containing protein [Bacteroidales bacterium]|nr:FecR domain-containing protein [Bacteroidales bacterium]
MDERIIKYFNQELSQSDRITLIREMELDDELRKDFAYYRNLMGVFSLAEHPNDKDDGQESCKHFIKDTKGRIRRMFILNVVRYAAVIAFLITGSWLGSHWYDHSNLNQNIGSNTLIVPAGQRASVILSDGTEVWLNARSTLKYPSYFKDGQRKVELRGEAFFKVTKDPKKPFIVSTSTIDIKVLGTVFNVSDYKEMQSTNVSLLEGSVEVSAPQQKKSGKVTLRPMQGLNYKDGNMTLTSISNENIFLWRNGLYCFEKTPLSEIVKRLELYYDVKIQIKNPVLSNTLYTGKFRQQDGVYEILRIIQKIHKFKIEKDELNKTIILK